MSKEIISLREFARRMNVGEKTIRDGIKTGKISKGRTEVNGKPKIIYEIAKKEFEDYRLGGQLEDRKSLSDFEDFNKVWDNTEIEYTDSETCGIADTASYSEATRQEKIHKARKAYLEVEELSGRLVSKDLVYKELYKFGSIIKSELKAIPDRITDELISLSSDRDAFYSFFSQTIEDALLKLSDTNDIQI